MDVSHNRLVSLPDSFSRSESLLTFICRENHLTSLPMLPMTLSRLEIDGNELLDPPESVVAAGLQGIRAYLAVARAPRVEPVTAGATSNEDRILRELEDLEKFVMNGVSTTQTTVTNVTTTAPPVQVQPPLQPQPPQQQSFVALGEAIAEAISRRVASPPHPLPPHNHNHNHNHNTYPSFHHSYDFSNSHSHSHLQLQQQPQQQAYEVVEKVVSAIHDKSATHARQIREQQQALMRLQAELDGKVLECVALRQTVAQSRMRETDLVAENKALRESYAALQTMLGQISAALSGIDTNAGAAMLGFARSFHPPPPPPSSLVTTEPPSTAQPFFGQQVAAVAARSAALGGVSFNHSTDQPHFESNSTVPPPPPPQQQPSSSSSNMSVTEILARSHALRQSLKNVIKDSSTLSASAPTSVTQIPSTRSKSPFSWQNREEEEEPPRHPAKEREVLSKSPDPIADYTPQSSSSTTVIKSLPVMRPKVPELDFSALGAAVVGKDRYGDDSERSSIRGSRSPSVSMIEERQDSVPPNNNNNNINPPPPSKQQPPPQQRHHPRPHIIQQQPIHHPMHHQHPQQQFPYPYPYQFR